MAAGTGGARRAGKGATMGPKRSSGSSVELVRVGDVEFFVEVADGGGPRTVGVADALSLDGVRDTVEAVAATLAAVWQRVRPAEASVEFGLSLTTRAGKLTGLLIDGEGSASLRVTLTWRSPAPAEA